MLNSSQVTFDSTLEDLVYHDVQVTSTTLGRVIAQEFYQNQDLPGILVVDLEQLMGMISRVNFRESMNHLNHQDLYLNHPVKLLLEMIRVPPLLLSKDCVILEAANLALNRPGSSLYEPIVVQGRDSQFRLIDIQQLLMAQNHLLNYSYHKIQRQHSKLQYYSQKIKQEKIKSKKYAKSLQEEQFLLDQRSNQDYTQKQAKLVEQTQATVHLNQKFIQVGQLLSVEIRQAFDAIFVSVNSIARNDSQRWKIIQGIDREVEGINSASELIEEMIQRVQHLAVQATVIAYQSNSDQQGLNQVVCEINRLVSQTANLSEKLHKIAQKIKFSLPEIQPLEATQETHRILLKIEQAETVLKKLEDLVSSSKTQHRKSKQYLNASHIIHTIERALKQQEDSEL